jgi:hypothetical protein
MDFVIDYIATDPTLSKIYGVTRAIVMILDLLLVAVAIYALNKLWKYRPKFVYDPRKWQRYVKTKKKKVDLSSPVVLSAWSKIQSKVKENTPDSMRLAVIEADGILDEVLKRMGLGGETLADRLGNLKPGQYHSLDRVWDAHRLRNNLVHTPDFPVSIPKAEEAIAAYESFLKEAKAL